MSRFEEKEKLVDTLLQLIPNAFELRWDQATLWERWANEMLMKLSPVEALALYQKAIQEKKRLLSNFEKDRDQWDKKRYYLAQTCLIYAKICTNMNLYNEARTSLSFIFELLNKDIFSAEYQRRVLFLLIDGHRMMIDIL